MPIKSLRQETGIASPQRRCIGIFLAGFVGGKKRFKMKSLLLLLKQNKFQANI